jgi:hypothetical protein
MLINVQWGSPFQCERTSLFKFLSIERVPSLRMMKLPEVVKELKFNLNVTEHWYFQNIFNYATEIHLNWIHFLKKATKQINRIHIFPSNCTKNHSMKVIFSSCSLHFLWIFHPWDSIQYFSWMDKLKMFILILIFYQICFQCGFSRHQQCNKIK